MSGHRWQVTSDRSPSARSHPAAETDRTERRVTSGSEDGWMCQTEQAAEVVWMRQTVKIRTIQNEFLTCIIEQPECTLSASL
jgi:hypothetical protein